MEQKRTTPEFLTGKRTTSERITSLEPNEIIRSMFMLTIVYEKMIGTIIHKDSVFIKAYCIKNILIGNKTKSKLTQLTQLVG